jgi:hypothetical protein
MTNWFSLPSRNAPLAETGWLRLAPCFVEDGWPLRWARTPSPVRTRFRIPAPGLGKRGAVIAAPRLSGILPDPRWRPAP